MNLAMIRIGHGYDVHRFSDVFLEDKPLKLCGLVLPEQRSLLAHSDAMWCYTRFAMPCWVVSVVAI